MNYKSINSIRILSCTLVGYSTTKDFPLNHGNCFSVEGNDGSPYRIINFCHENIEEALKRGINWPIRISILQGNTAVIDDDRIPSDWYNKDYCNVCCPDDLLLEPQKMEIQRQYSRGQRVDIPPTEPDGGGNAIAITRIDMSKQPRLDPPGEKKDNSSTIWSPYVPITVRDSLSTKVYDLKKYGLKDITMDFK